MKTFFLFFVWCAFSFFFNNSSQAYEIKYYREGLFTFQTGVQQFYSQYNYTNAENTYERLPAGGSFKVLNTTAELRWLPLERLGVFAQTVYGYAESNNSINIRTNNGISSYTLGGDYKLYDGYFDLLAEVSAILPGTRISSLTDNAIFCEGDQGFDAKAILQKRGTYFRDLFSIGYRSRDEGRSSLLTWDASLEFQFKSFILGGNIGGFSSLTYDKFSDSAYARNEVTTRVNAGSFKYYSVNPSIIEANGWVGFDFNPGILVKVGGGTTITGRNEAAGYNIFASFMMLFIPSKKSSAEKFKAEIQPEPEQVLFTPPPLEDVAPTPPEKVEEPSSKNSGTTTTPTPAVSNNAPQINVNPSFLDELNEVEMDIKTIEKKGRKKKSN